MNLKIKDIVKHINGELILGDPKAVATRAVVDSRQIKSGDLFFALKGERVDGHDFALSACTQGAAGVVVSRLSWFGRSHNFSNAVIKVEDTAVALKLLAEYVRSGFKGPVIGITGSNGKTTTKQMVTSVMKETGPGLSTAGNFNSQIGMPMVISQLEPDAKWMVLEMGASEPGNIAGLAEIAKPTIGIVTSIGAAHLKSFGSIENIAATKWELMESLPQDGCGIAPWGVSYLEPHIRNFTKRLVYFGDDPSCTVRATSIEMGEHVKFTLHVAGKSAPVTLPVSGRFNVSNALAAAAVGWVQSIPLDQIVHALQNFEPPKMRMEFIAHPSGATLINDAYNANPSSMLLSVRSVMEMHPHRKKILVVGSMLELGDDADRMHFHVGTELGRFAVEHVYMVGEDAKKIQEGAVSVGANAKKFEWLPDIPTLVDHLRMYLRPESVILFKGSRAMKLEEAIQKLLDVKTSN